MSQTLKEYIEARANEVLKTKAKDTVINHGGATKISAEDQKLASDFYKALSTKSTAEIEAVNGLVAKQYKAKAGQSITTIGTGTAGGVLVPTSVADSIIQQLIYISPMRQIATHIDNMPAQLQLPSESTTVTGYWVAEGAPVTASAEVFAPNILTPYKLGGLDTFTSELLQDAATNPSIQKFVENRFAVALALAENAAFVSGTGSGQPWGFRSSYITPTAVAQAGGALAYSDIVNLQYSLGTAYRQQAVFLTSSKGVRALVNLKDTQGRPLFIESIRDGVPATLLGKPVYIVDEIPANLGGGTNATEIWYMVPDRYVIGDRLGLTIDYGTQGTDFAADQISLRVIKRVAGMPIDSNAFAKLTGVLG